MPTRRALALLPLMASPVRAEPCCGRETPKGRALASFLDGMHVEQGWENHWHVNWLTGLRDRPNPGGHEAATHCSAFVAAVAYRLGIYVLRPPDHPQELLANAQMRWLREHGAASGWRPVATAREAQAIANAGDLALMVFEAPDPHRPGHIAVIRPSDKTLDALNRDGPQITQAGATNYRSVAAATGFRHHAGAWAPGGTGSARYFAHAIAPQALGVIG